VSRAAIDAAYCAALESLTILSCEIMRESDASAQACS
jgi:hypothetical protein